ncbi:retrovirus-related pol polyprotein from transposon TNT 1-94 [Tanacetum coccineum]
METIHVQFDELTEHMAPVQLSTGPAPTFLTHGQISSGLVPNPVPAAPYVPPTNKELEILFQPMFDEYLEATRAERLVSPALAVLVSVNSADTPSSTTIDQDAPSPSHLPLSSALQSPSLHQGVAVESTLIEEASFCSYYKVICEYGDVLKEEKGVVARGYSYLHRIAPSKNMSIYSNGCQDSIPNGDIERESLKQAPRAWYDTLSRFLLDNKFSKGAVDPTLFTQKTGKHILLVQIYVNDIIFASTDPKACDIFSNEMSSNYNVNDGTKCRFSRLWCGFGERAAGFGIGVLWGGVWRRGGRSTGEVRGGGEGISAGDRGGWGWGGGAGLGKSAGEIRVVGGVRVRGAGVWLVEGRVWLVGVGGGVGSGAGGVGERRRTESGACWGGGAGVVRHEPWEGCRGAGCGCSFGVCVVVVGGGREG